MSRTNRARDRRQSSGAVPSPWRSLQNPYEPTKVLSDDHVEHIHRSSLGLLQSTGMRVLQPQARQILADAGCVVEDLMVRFDPELVEAMVALAPSSFTLRARNPARNLTIGGRNVVFTSVGGPAFANDVERGRRPGTHAQQMEYLRLVQTLDIIQQEGGGPFEAMYLAPETRHLDLCHSLIRLLDKNWQGIDRDGLAESPALLTIVNTNTRAGQWPVGPALRTAVPLVEYHRFQHRRRAGCV